MGVQIVLRAAIYGIFLCGLNNFAVVINAATPDETSITDGAASTAPEAEQVHTDLLAKVRVVNDELYSSLQSFVCNEQMQRFEGSLDGDSARHIDTVSTKVSFENGVEHYTDIFQNQQQRASISSVPGAWSEGEFGTLLQQTQILLNVGPVSFRKYTEVNGTPAALYAVNISEQNSPWDLEVERRHYRIPFRTDVWVSRTTGEILKIERVSTTIPRRVGISEIRWGVTLKAVKLDEKTWLLPATGSYAVLYRSTGRREWNEMSFSEYRRYGSEVALRFQ